MEVKFEGEGFDKLNKAIRDLIRKIKNPIKVFAEAKLIIFQDVMRHFQKQEGPDGKWKPLKLATLKRRRQAGRGAKILQDTGRLKNSISGIASSRGAEVGTNMVYARTHQKGRGNIPQRQFLWLSKEAGNRILDRFIVDIKGI